MRRRRFCRDTAPRAGWYVMQHACATGLRVGLSPHLLPSCLRPPLVATFSRCPFRARGVTCNIPASFSTTLTCPSPPALPGVRLCVTTHPPPTPEDPSQEWRGATPKTLSQEWRGTSRRHRLRATPRRGGDTHTSNTARSGEEPPPYHHNPSPPRRDWKRTTTTYPAKVGGLGERGP